MPIGSPHQVTKLLIQWSEGDELALEELMPLVYGELRIIARRYIRQQNGGNTFQTTDLIHEAYLKLVNKDEQEWKNRTHFFSVASKAMRHILIDHARSRQTGKRGATQVVSLEEGNVISPERADEIVALDEALSNLGDLDERKMRVVEMRYFGGLTVEETADVLNVSTITVIRDWNFSKMWLLRELSNPV
ncbi:MAG: sigma-70 family RNA polymerase sigma factor [Pyrinomonadaceae bacterium]